MLEKYTLPNGIPLFVYENHASPVVSIQAWVARGSSHEPDSLAGISHFIEHALFKGTKKRDVGQIALEIEACGGEVNAFTSFDETVYYATLASRYFEEGLDVITDAIQNPTFDKQEMDREREVILEEIKRAHDSGLKQGFLNLWKHSFRGTPYGRPVLGFEKTVSAMQARTLKSYYEKNYNSGSVALFMVGDIDTKSALANAKTKLQRFRKGKPLRRADLKFGRLSKTAVETIGKDVNECHTMIGFRTAAIHSSQIPALDVLVSAIGQGESGRLYQKLVKEKKVALDVDISLTATQHCGLATVHLVTAPEAMEDAIHEARTVLEELPRAGVEETEIERVKSAMEVESVYSKETVEGYARKMGYYYRHFGEPDYESLYLQSLLRLSQQEIEESANLFRTEQPCVSIVHPKGMEIDKDRIRKLMPAKSKPKKVIKPLKPVFERKISGGVPFVYKVSHSVPSISMRLLFLGGSREDPQDKLGIGTLFQRTWTQGTKSYTSYQLAHELESLGASVNAFSGRNTLGLTIDCLKKHWPKVEPIFREILTQPTFPEHEFETEKDHQLKDIASEKDSPSYLCSINFSQHLYRNHPYGRPSIGTKETVEKLTTLDLRDHYRHWIHRKNLVVSTVGDIVPERWIERVEAVLESIPESGLEPQARSKPTPPEKLDVITASKQPLFQSHLIIGFLAASFSDKERWALKVLNSALAGQGGRLFLQLRDKQSLAYTVSPMNSDSPDPGTFGVYIGCSPEKVESALVGIRGEIEKILDKPMAKSELERAKNYYLGRFELDMQRHSSQAMVIGLDEIYGLGYNAVDQVPKEIRKVSSKDIQKAAQKYFDLQRATISLVHPTEVDPATIADIWTRRA